MMEQFVQETLTRNFRKFIASHFDASSYAITRTKSTKCTLDQELTDAAA